MHLLLSPPKQTFPFPWSAPCLQPTPALLMGVCVFLQKLYFMLFQVKDHQFFQSVPETLQAAVVLPELHQ